MNENEFDIERRRIAKLYKKEIPPSQKYVGYFFIVLGLLLIIILPIAIAIRGVPERGLFALIIAMIVSFIGHRLSP